MSTLRNIAAHLWRGSLVRKANVILGVTGAALSAACAAEQVTAPSAATATSNVAPTGAGPRAGRSPANSARSAKDSVKQYNKAQMDSLKADWQAYQRAVQNGTVEADFLRCEPKPALSVTKVIGRKGSTFNIGPHKFEVPAGALDSNVAITATAPTNSVADLRFQPHGLQFNKPVQMTISYKGCVVPDSAVLGIAYVAHPWQSAIGLRGKADQRMPAHDDKTTSTVSGLTDHFSGYMVTWARTSAE